MVGIIATNQTTQQPTTIFNQSLPKTEGDWARFKQRLAEAFQAISNAQYTTGVNAVPASYSVYFGTALPNLTVTGATASLDSSTRQFGQSSLKLIATSSTVTVALNGFPCTVQPNWQWIGSLYLKSSLASITGTLQVQTPAKTYTVNVSGAISGWSRPYGSFDLTADASSSATLVLTLTGVTVGSTFWIEAWQLEPTQGTTALPSPYILTHPPVNQDQLPDGSTYGRVNNNNLTGNNVDFSQPGLLNKTQDFVSDGSTYARILGTQLSSGQHKLTVPGSGMRVGDQRNLLQRTITNVPSKVPTVISYSAAAGTPATATISVAAFSVLAGSVTTNYNAMSVGTTGTNGTAVTYYLYFLDPSYAGGTQTLIASTNPNDVYANDGSVYAGSISVTYPSSGSGSGSGGGGGGTCVVEGQGSPLGVIDGNTKQVATPDGPADVRRIYITPANCLRVKCANGAILECSYDAPLMGEDGVIDAFDSRHKMIETSEGLSEVIGLRWIGAKAVVAIDAGDVAFYAGSGPYILHHNKLIP